MVTPQPGSYVQVLHGAGSESSYSSEPMQEVNLFTAQWGFRPRYTVYRITSPAKSIMKETTTPVFHIRVHNTGEFGAVVPDEIWYGVGYIVFNTPRNNDDVIKCLSGKYVVPTTIIGCVDRKFTKKRKQEDITLYGDAAIRRKGSIEDWDASLTAFYGRMCAEATSVGGAVQSHIRGIHELGGVAGNAVTFDLVDDNAEALSVTVAASAITVHLDTDIGEPCSTAMQVVAALNNSSDVRALKVRFELAHGEIGTGIVADSGPYTLAGGLDELDYDALQDEEVVFRFYSVYTAGDMYVGYGKIENVDWQGGPSDMLKAGLSVVGAKYPMRHVIHPTPA